MELLLGECSKRSKITKSDEIQLLVWSTVLDRWAVHLSHDLQHLALFQPAAVVDKRDCPRGYSELLHIFRYLLVGLLAVHLVSCSPNSSLVYG